MSELVVKINSESLEEIHGLINVDNMAPGLADANYVHIQSTPASEWLVNHGLKKYPSVVVIDSANNVVICDVEYLDIDNLITRSAGAFSGKAICN